MTGLLRVQRALSVVYLELFFWTGGSTVWTLLSDIFFSQCRIYEKKFKAIVSTSSLPKTFSDIFFSQCRIYEKKFKAIVSTSSLPKTCGNGSLIFQEEVNSMPLPNS